MAAHDQLSSWLQTFANGMSGFADAAIYQLTRLGLLLLFIAVGYLVGRIAKAIYEAVVRGKPTSGQQLMSKAFLVLFTLLGISVGLSYVYAANLGAVAASLGVASLALGFGLQNTVANLAAGVSLSVDKPFEVGDRIQVGETWGDAIGIGLRSTRIRVTGGQTVSIPNAMLDTREVWNSTYAGNQWLRLQIPFSISYDSSVPLAESLCLKVARGRPEVMAYPPPQVRMRALGNDGIELELRCWISHAQERAWVTDRLLRGIKEAFDEAGVHFPFPQRTISMASELPPAAETPPQLAGLEDPHGKILVVARSHYSSSRLAGAIVEFAGRVSASIVVLHVRPVHQAHDHMEGEGVLNDYLYAAQEVGVKAKGRLEVGNVTAVVPRVAKEEGVSLVLLGHGTDRPWAFWMRNEVQDIKAACQVPLLAMEVSQLLRPEVVDHWRGKLTANEQAPTGSPPPPKAKS